MAKIKNPGRKSKANHSTLDYIACVEVKLPLCTETEQSVVQVAGDKYPADIAQQAICPAIDALRDVLPTGPDQMSLVLVIAWRKEATRKQISTECQVLLSRMAERSHVEILESKDIDRAVFCLGALGNSLKSRLYARLHESPPLSPFRKRLSKPPFCGESDSMFDMDSTPQDSEVKPIDNALNLLVNNRAKLAECLPDELSHAVMVVTRELAALRQVKETAFLPDEEVQRMSYREFFAYFDQAFANKDATRAPLQAQFQSWLLRQEGKDFGSFEANVAFASGVQLRAKNMNLRFLCPVSKQGKCEQPASLRYRMIDDTGLYSFDHTAGELRNARHGYSVTVPKLLLTHPNADRSVRYAKLTDPTSNR